MKLEHIIQFEEVSKFYTSDFRRIKTQALQSISFNVNSGEVFGIIGANGAGKSTCIKILMGFISFSTGSVLLNNKSPLSNSAHVGVGYLPENPCLYKNLSITEHLQFAAKILNLKAHETKAKIEKLLHRVELTHVAKTPIRKFSKGMTQRAALAYTLLGDPEILILDEPMSGLDPLGRQIVIDIITEHQQQGKTTLFCSHILTDVERICSRIAIMNKGQLAATINPDEIKLNPNPENGVAGSSPLESFFLDTLSKNNQ